MITNTIINYYQLYMILLVWDVRNAATCLGFFLSLLIRTDTDTDTDTSSCFIWVLVYFFFFDICHVVNIKFIGWYIMYFCQPGFFFPSKIYNVAYRSPSYIVLLVQQQTEYRSKNTTELSHTQRWRLTADDSSSQNNGGCW